MSGLNGSLSIALSALLVSQQEVGNSANNVANANTPGFSRRRPDLVPGDPIVIGRLSIGTGVDLLKLEMPHNSAIRILSNKAKVSPHLGRV